MRYVLRKATIVVQFEPEALFQSGDDHEQVVHCHDRRTGLRAVIAIHSTARGPALGGTRFHAYPDPAVTQRLVTAFEEHPNLREVPVERRLGQLAAVKVRKFVYSSPEHPSE